MKPEHNKTEIIWKKGLEKQSIEIGKSTWNPKTTSIRNRYDKNGRFSRSASSELNPEDLEPIMCCAAKHDLLKPKECEAIVKAMTASIRRQRGQ
jgi:hypothetical protein